MYLGADRPDPFGTPLHWTQPPGFAQPKTADGQIAMVSDFLYMLRENTVLPKPGDELRTPVLGLGDEAAPEASAARLGPAETAKPPGHANPPRPPGRPGATGAHGALETPPHTM